MRTRSAPFLSESWYRVANLRPKLREHATLQRHRYRGTVWYVVHDHGTGRVHRMSAASQAIVSGMDGTRSVGELWREAAIRLGERAEVLDELTKVC